MGRPIQIQKDVVLGQYLGSGVLPHGRLEGLLDASFILDPRIAQLILPDGELPLEMRRTRSLHYPLFDPQAFTILAICGESVGFDLLKLKNRGRQMSPSGLFIIVTIYERQNVAEEPTARRGLLRVLGMLQESLDKL